MAKKRLILVKEEDYSRARNLLRDDKMTTYSDDVWYFHGITAVVTFVCTGLLFGLLWLIL